MNIPVTRTKHIVPRRRPDLLSRPRLVDVLNELLDNRLTIIAAPAGYGKTSLLVDIAHQTNMPFCWFAIDPLDRDFKRFVTYLIASINHQFPNFGKQTSLILQELSQLTPDLDLLVTSLVNEAYDAIREHFVIVLDDYHFVDDQADINRFIGKFIREVDENCHVVIASRTLLTLPDLPLMVARSQVGGLGFDELAFQPDEISALIDKNYHVKISETAAEELVEQTEGWITGLLLSTELKWEGLNERMRLARVSTAGLYEYLAEQVLDRQNEEIREFLLHTSVMDEFDADLCQAVFGSPHPGKENWSNLINQVSRSNLFVLPVGERKIWLRYHHLFRDFLHEKLHKEDPVLENQILKNLADAYTQRNDWERAYSLYQRLNRVDDLVNLIEKSGSDLLKTGRITTLSIWIDALNISMLETRPTLLSLRGSVAVMQGEVERGISLLNQCEIVCRRTNNLAVLSRMLTRRSHAYIFLCDYRAALKDADESLIIAQNESFLIDEAESLRCRGLALYYLGSFDEAIQNLKNSITSYDIIGNSENIAMIQIEMGMIYRVTGNYYLAEESYEKALKQFVQAGDLVRQASVQNNLGYLFYICGDYEKSSSYYERASANVKQIGSLRLEANILASIGDLYKSLNSPESALSAYMHAQEILKKINDGFLEFYLVLAEAVIFRIQGDYLHSEEKLEQASALAEQSNSPSEIGLVSTELGLLQFEKKDYRSALESIHRAKEIYDNKHQGIEQIQCELYLGNILLAMGNETEAVQSVHNAFELSKSIQTTDILPPVARDAKNLLVFAARDADLNALCMDLLKSIEEFESALPGLRRKLRKQTSTVPIAPPKLTIKSLGRSQVLVDGKVVTNSQWQTSVSRDLLFLLLTDPEGFTKEAIAEIFWPENNASQIKLQFKNTIYRVRHALNLDVIIWDDDRYRFNQDIDYEYDVDTFQSRISQAQVAESLEKQIGFYKSALSLYKGNFLPEVEGIWVHLEREKLHHTYLNATMQLIELYLKSQDYQSGLKLCQDIQAKDSCLEEAYRLAMRIHAAMGNKADVVRQYERCEQILRKEVHLPPSEKTRSLYEELIR